LINPDNTGIEIQAGSTYTISWEVKDELNKSIQYPHTTIYASWEGASSWQTIAADYAGSNFQYTWQVPTVLSNKSYIAVDIANILGSPVSRGTNTTPFKIVDKIAPVASMDAMSKYIGKSTSISWHVSDLGSPVGSTYCLSSKTSLTTNEGMSWIVLQTLSSPNNSGIGFTYFPLANTNVPYPFGRISLEVSDSSNNKTDVISSPFGIDTKAPTMDISITTEAASGTIPISILPHDENGISTVEVLAGEGGIKRSYSPSNIPTFISIVPPLLGTHNVTITAYDTGGNMTVETFTIKLDMTPIPQISGVNIDNKDIGSLSYASKQPTVQASIYDYHGDLKQVKITMTAGGQSYSYIVTPVRPTADLTYYTVSVEAAQAFTDTGSFTVKIEASDGTYVGTMESSPLSITSIASVTVRPKVIPNPFRPRHNIGATFVYQLSTDTEMQLIVYDITGKAVYHKTLAAGSEGGKGPNYDNKVYWDGRDDFGKYVANGVYIYLLTADKKVLVKGQLTAID
jgi:hypothetical protein